MNLTDAATHAATSELPLSEIPSIIDTLLNPDQPLEPKAHFLKSLALRGETAAELAAFSRSILPKATPLPFSGTWNNTPILDCCGTGGGGLSIVNISTGAIFIMAAAGIPVTKHGNRGLTKKSGSSDVLTALGIEIQASPETATKCMEEINVCFLLAPIYHPAFKAIMPVRQALAAEGQRTIFNLLGPLLNPAQPHAQMLGVFKQEHLPLFSDALTLRGCKRFAVIHGSHHDHTPIGEVSASGKTLWQGTLDEKPIHFTDHPQTSSQDLDSLKISTPEESATRLLAVLENRENGLLKDLLIRNAGAGIWIQGKTTSLEAGCELATETLESGKALSVLKNWRRITPAP